jgi:uncharacterized protein (TIGR01777 family)
MKVVLPGGSGHLGTLLAGFFHKAGDDVVVLSRRPRAAPWRIVAWDGKTFGEWSKEIDGAEVVINLAGRSVNCRYTPANRAEIMDSRVESTRAVGVAIAKSKRPPRAWLQMSTATIYSHRYDAPNDEVNGTLGGNEPNAPDTWRFSIDVARAWEAAFEEATVPATRKVALRSAVVMSPMEGGAFATLMSLAHRGLGGRAGDGRQYVSWIHDTDFARAIQWIIRHQLTGVVNVAAPGPLPQEELMDALRRAAGIRFALPALSWMLEIGAVLLRTETELILKSRRVVPTRLLTDGFVFTYPYWTEAVFDLVRRREAAGPV